MYTNWKKKVILFLSSQTLSQFGSFLVMYAILWHITLETQSGIMMTIYMICSFLPTFFLSPFAGVWADRYNRKMMIILSDSMIAFVTLILAILFLMGYEALWLLFAISAIRAVGSGIQTPAVQAFLPQIVPEDQLTRINGINSSIQAFITLTSPLLSGALLTVATIEVIFFIDVITAAVAVLILLFFLRVPAHNKASQKQTTGYLQDVREGFRYIKNHAFLKSFFLFCAFFFFLSAPAAFLTPLQVARSFGEDIWRLTAIEIAFSVGMMVGGVIMASWGGFKNKVHTMTLSCLVIGICTVAFGTVPNFWIYLVFMTIVGIAMPIYNTPSTVILQERVVGDYLGRVFGILSMISSSMMPLGMLVFGPIADIIKIEWLLVGTGLLLFILSFFLIGNKALVEAGKPVTKGEQ